MGHALYQRAPWLLSPPPRSRRNRASLQQENPALETPSSWGSCGTCAYSTLAMPRPGAGCRVVALLGKGFLMEKSSPVAGAVRPAHPAGRCRVAAWCSAQHRGARARRSRSASWHQAPASFTKLPKIKTQQAGLHHCLIQMRCVRWRLWQDPPPADLNITHPFPRLLPGSVPPRAGAVAAEALNHGSGCGARQGTAPQNHPPPSPGLLSRRGEIHKGGMKVGES